MRPRGNLGLKGVLCPCFFGSKTDDDPETDGEENGEHRHQKSPFIAKKQIENENENNSQSGPTKISSAAACVIRKISTKKNQEKKDDLSLPPTIGGGGRSGRNRNIDLGCHDQDEITLDFERQSNASSMHQIPSLHTEFDINREACSQSGSRYACGRSEASRHSVDDVGSYRSNLRIDRTPSLSYCSEAGVAKSSSILVNIPSSRGSLSSFGRWSARRSPSPEAVRKDLQTPPNNRSINLSLSQPHMNRIDLRNKSNAPSTSPSWSGRNLGLQDRKY